MWFLLLIAEQSPAAWLQLARADPEMGRYSSRPGVQKWMKKHFARLVSCKHNWGRNEHWELPNGRRHGTLTMWFLAESGREELSSTGEYEEGVAVGVREFFEGGKLYLRNRLEAGKLHGDRERYYPSGRLRCRERYARGALQGEWHENGQLSMARRYANGTLHGDRNYHYPSGRPRRCEEYVRSVLHGRVREWHENGRLSLSRRYADGKPDGGAERWEDGAPLL